MEDEAGLYTAESVASKMVDAACTGATSCYWGLEGWMLTTLTSGMGPLPIGTSTFDFVTQIWTMGLLRFVAMFYLKSFKGIVEKCASEKAKEEKKKE